MLPGNLKAQSVERQKISSYSTIFPQDSGGLNSSYYQVQNFLDTGAIVISGFQQVDTVLISEIVVHSEIAITAFPNPVSEELFLRVNSVDQISYLVLNNLGQQVMNGRFTGNTRIKTGALSNGIYQLILTNDSKIVGAFKFIRS